ncbi:SPFH domain-containing protein [Nonomuraea sp. NPDC048826]|uniref:SPFH domain-containing protein n=1 Tax=Nonomuraea sp. NPDC048826 TaxID=3364347 RepID=UPI00371A0AA6
MFALGGQPDSTWQALSTVEPGVWFVAGLLLLAVLVSRALRVVGEDERLVVRRLGRVAGVRGPGLVVVWPFLERDVRVSRRLMDLDLFAGDAVTRDGVAVRARAGVMAVVDDPVRFATAAERPLTATATAAETVLRRRIARRDLADLPALVTHSGTDLADEVSETTQEWGVRVTQLDVADVQVPLTADLIAWGRGAAPGDRPREHAPA